VNESIFYEVRFKSAALEVSVEEIALLESVLPQIFLAMMQAEEENETEID
jgi:hypothetical protein